MSLEQQVIALTEATEQLLEAVNTRKADLNTAETNASLSAQEAQFAANQAADLLEESYEPLTMAQNIAGEAAISAGEAATSTSQALAVYGSAEALQTALQSAQNSARLAEDYAEAASSVVQQDLTGVTAAALHRSPNAITAMFVYDTSKDSDGGAWTEKCQHTSWYNEPINGKWLGAQASEAAARAVSGAATGDYFQLTTSGKFYKLNDTSGITEVFRGNKRDFPRLAGVVAEASSVTIYDLTEPGRPMFARFLNAAGYAFEGNNSSLAAQNGLLVVGSSTGEYEISFAKDSSAKRNVTSYYTRSGNLAGRNAVASWVDVGAAYKIANSTANAVAMTVLPDAPVDPVTGLQVPTIVVATAGGVSVIRHDGTITTLFSGRANTIAKAINNQIWISGSDGGSYAARLLNASLDAQQVSFAHSHYSSLGTPFIAGLIGSQTPPNNLQLSRKNAYITHPSAPSIISLLTPAPSNKVKSSVVYVANTYNTGHQPGDIRRTYLADNVVGSVSGPELVANGTFDTDTSGWTAGDGAILSVVSGKLSVVSGGSGAYSDARQELTTVPGRVYKLTADFIYVTSRGNIGVGTTAGGTELAYISPITRASSVSTLFVATSTTTHICFGTRDTTAGLEAQYDNISVKEVVGDRSYKAKGANITGTLTKSPVASNAQLVAYSGFSASNYLREPYSADLDFGTGEWSVSSWINIPVGNAAAGTIVNRAFSSGPYITIGIDTTNRLIATAYDGTNTRVVSTNQQYNTATWIKIETCYTIDGKLSLRINGIETTSTSGTPLLTLNNTSAVLTIGNSYNLDAPFPGSLALLKLSATVPTAEQSIWMYEQEKQMFREGAQVCLPDSGSIVDLAYDDSTDTWIAASATNVSEWSGLVRTKVTPTPAGSYSKLAASSGVQLQARTTNNPGVDITIPPYNIKGELEKRSESAAKIKKLTTFDYDSVSGQTEFVLPLGYTTKAVYVNGFAKWQGTTKDYTLLYDGFKETVKFAFAPTAASWIQIHAEKES